MRLPQAYDGEPLLVRQRAPVFSYWPTFQGDRREGAQWTLFSTNPWFAIRNSLANLDAEAKAQADAFLEQAQDFYKAATQSDITAARPLLLYYAFLNLAKCLYVKTTSTKISTRVTHGLSERLPVTPNALHGEIHVLRNQDNTSAFRMFSDALELPLPAAAPGQSTAPIRSQDFLSQILIGHRVWCKGSSVNERFVSIHDIRYFHDEEEYEAWVRMRIFSDDLKRFGYSQREVATSLNQHGGNYRAVRCDDAIDGRPLNMFEPETVRGYPNRPSEVLQDLSNDLKNVLWRSVLSIPPYRKYYVYLPTASQVVLGQLQSIYMATYYFGSITRYKPEQFSGILSSPIGPFVEEFFTNQPRQFLYLIASEFIGQEVTKAAIV